MAIVIKELLASDTLSDAADKINFNFDQLLLNGGGPVGPRGPIGPIGPIGGRGIRGSQWFKDPTPTPGTDPNNLIFIELEEGDNFLQANGTVWNWNGTVWSNTSINLTGPQGIAGTSGFSRFGGPINNQQSIYISPMPGGTAAGASNVNEAIPTLVVGGVVSITPPTDNITYQRSLINDTMAESIDSTNSAMIIRQLDQTSAAIRFMGGGIGQNYEQLNISNLASISLIQDDRIRIEIPKAPINTSTLINLTGYIVDTVETGQFYLSGKHINFITGQSSNSSGSSFENSDFNVQVNKSTGASGNPRIRLNVTTTGGGLAAGIEIGSNTTIPVSTANTGSIIAQGGLIGLIGSSTISLITSSNISQQATGNITLSSGGAISANSAGNTSLTTTNGNISLTAQGSNRDINAMAGRFVVITANSTLETANSGNLRILANTLSATPTLGLYNATTTASGTITGTASPQIRVRIRGNNHIRHRSNAPADNKPILTPKDDFILLSGQFRVVGDGTTNTGGFGTGTTMSWMRVGKVVHVSGRGFGVTCTGSTITIPVPVVTSANGTSLDLSFGADPRGTCIITTGGASPSTTVGVVEGSVGTSFNIVKRTMGGDTANWNLDDVYTFTFTYTLNGG